MKSELDVEMLLEQILRNIGDDRDLAQEFLTTAKQLIGMDPDQFKEIANPVAKLIESKQRSNEQLVKLTLELRKRQKDAGGFKLTGDDMESLRNEELEEVEIEE